MKRTGVAKQPAENVKPSGPHEWGRRVGRVGADDP